MPELPPPPLISFFTSTHPKFELWVYMGYCTRMYCIMYVLYKNVQCIMDHWTCYSTFTLDFNILVILGIVQCTRISVNIVQCTVYTAQFKLD